LLLGAGPWGPGRLEARNTPVQVRRLGLSKVGDNTILTVVLDRPATPRVKSLEVAGEPQLVVDFPRARAGRLPNRLEGDDILVKQVLTDTKSPTGGVRIILKLFPEIPYTYWKKSRPGQAGQTFFLLGLKSAASTSRVQTRPEPPVAAPTPPAETTPEVRMPEPATTADAPEPTEPEPAESEGESPKPMTTAVPGSFGELTSLMPRAASLLQGLRDSGWVLVESNRYDRPGRRFSRDFTMTNSKYPELVVKIAYLPANVPNTPNIDIIMLSTENIQSEAATKYRDLRQWSFAKIKKKFEDIGDFFDDAMKPVRVELRKETQAVALKDAVVFQNFLKLVKPNDPQLIDKVMKHIREKVSPRFKGVEYTESEKPLVFLNLVDFLYVKVYFVGDH
jgi:hypothetical protein